MSTQKEVTMGKATYSALALTLLLSSSVAVAEINQQSADLTSTFKQAVEKGTSLSEALKSAISANPEQTASILLLAIQVAPGDVDSLIKATLEVAPTSATLILTAIANAFGPTSDQTSDALSSIIATLGPVNEQISQVLTAAKNSGLPVDTITGIAVALGVDATLASQATAAGTDPNSQTNPTQTVNVVPPVVVPPVTNVQGAGGGGGENGISEGNG